MNDEQGCPPSIFRIESLNVVKAECMECAKPMKRVIY